MEVIASQISECIRTGQAEDAYDLLAQLMKAKVALKFSMEESDPRNNESSILENRPLQADTRRRAEKEPEGDDLNALLFGGDSTISTASPLRKSHRHGCVPLEGKEHPNEKQRVAAAQDQKVKKENKNDDADCSLMDELDSLADKNVSKKQKKVHDDEDDCANCESCQKMKEKNKFMHLSISGLERLSKLRDLGFSEDEALESIKKCNSVDECIEYIESKRKTLGK